MEILQSNLHPQPQDQLEQVAQGCGQLGFKCLRGWRLYTSRDMLQDWIKITIKKKSFLMFKWNFLFVSSCTLPFVPPLDTTDANLSTAGYHLLAHAAGTSVKTCTERCGSIHQRTQQIHLKQGYYKPAARSQS